MYHEIDEIFTRALARQERRRLEEPQADPYRAALLSEYERCRERLLDVERELWEEFGLTPG